VINPFVALYESPVATLTAVAYALLLAACTWSLGGLIWHLILRVRLAIEHRTTEKFGPRWQHAPPLRVVGLVGLTISLAAVEVALLGGIVYLLPP